LSTVSLNLEMDVDHPISWVTNLLVAETGTLERKAESNPGVNASGGTSIQAARMIAI
jgi:hypothetical protein